MTRDDLKAKTAGTILGVAIGDALGLPCECKSPAGIRNLFGFVDRYVTNEFHGYREVAKRAPGTVSDDTQLTLAMLDSFTRKRGYDIKDIALAHVEAWEGRWGTPVGWGGSTREACQRIKAGEKETFSPKGAGNGTCMKIAPLSLYSVYKTIVTAQKRFTNSFNASLLKKCREITLLTHGDPRCIVAAYCQARMVIRAIQNEIPQVTGEIADLFLKDAQYAEAHLRSEWPDNQPLSERMKVFLAPEQFLRETELVSVDICSNHSSFVMNSYPLVAYCVSKYLPYRNFKHAVTMTVNAGADADSNGSMVGAIMGGWLGVYEIPSDLLSGVKIWREIYRCAKNFHLAL